MYEYKAKVLRVIDGDTIELEIDLGFFVKIKITGRIAEVDTPERGDVEFQTAKAFLIKLLEDVTNNGEIIIKTKKTEKYGRWLIYIDGVNQFLKERWPYV